MQRKVRDGKYHVAKVSLTLLLILCGLVLGLGRQFYDEAMVDAFFALALASVVIIHLRTRPRWLDVVLIAVGTAFLATVDFHTLHYPTTAGQLR